MQRKRFIIATEEGRFVASVYADRYVERPGIADSSTGARGGGDFYEDATFFEDARIICSVNPGYKVGDSGGRLCE